MKEIAVWVLIGMFLVSGILMKGHQSEATDYTNSTMPIDNTTILIEEEKEQEETNVTNPSGIKSGLWMLTRSSKTQEIYVSSGTF